MNKKSPFYPKPSELLICEHEWIVAERIDLPVEPGYVTNVLKLYCPKCREFHIIDWDKRQEAEDDEDQA